MDRITLDRLQHVEQDISGKKCRHLNKEGVDMEKQLQGLRDSYLTSNLFLRHNHIFIMLRIIWKHPNFIVSAKQNSKVAARCFAEFSKLSTFRFYVQSP